MQLMVKGQIDVGRRWEKKGGVDEVFEGNEANTSRWRARKGGNVCCWCGRCWRSLQALLSPRVLVFFLGRRHWPADLALVLVLALGQIPVLTVQVLLGVGVGVGGDWESCCRVRGLLA